MSRRALAALALLSALALAAVPLSAADLPGDVAFLRQTQILAPHADHAFEIDGTVSEAERAACAAIDQFLSFEPEATGVDGSTAWLAHTGTELYVAFCFDRPPGAPPVASANEFDDIALWKLDDAAELMLTPGGTTWDFIGNSAGVMGDYVHRPQNWDFSSDAWSFAARATDSGWEGEFLIPAEVIGLEALGPEIDVQFDLINNAKSLSLNLLSYRGGHWHANMEYWPRLRFGAQGQSYQTQQSVGDLGDEKIGLRAKLTNPSDEAREVEAWAAFYRAPDDEDISWFSEVGGLYQTEGIAVLPGATEEELIRTLAGNALGHYVQAGAIDETMTVPAGGSADVDLWRHSLTGTYLVAHLLRDAATGAVLSGGVYPFTVAPPLKTDIHYYYLTGRRIYALTLVPSDPAIDALRYRVTPAAGGGPVGEEIAVHLQPGARTKTPISSAGWPAGDYVLQVEALDAGGGVLRSNAVSFTKPPTPDWFGSDAGRQIDVSWPWTPVGAEDGAVEVWGRRIEIVPGDDEVLLRVRLIDTPTQIANRRTLTFGLQAWPVKPWPDEEKHVTNYLISDRANDEDWSFEEQLRRAMALGMDLYEWFHWNSFTTETGAKHPPEYPMLPPGEKRATFISGFSGERGGTVSPGCRLVDTEAGAGIALYTPPATDNE